MQHARMPSRRFRPVTAIVDSLPGIRRFVIPFVTVFSVGLATRLPAQGDLAVQQVLLGAAPVAAALGDLQGDGFTDLVVVNGQTAAVDRITGNGAGLYAPLAALGSLGAAAGTTDVVFGDLDLSPGDDLVTCNRADGTLTRFANNGAGVFTASLIDLDTLAGGTLAPAYPIAMTIVSGTVPELWVVTAGTFFQPSLSRVLRITSPFGVPTATVMASGGSFTDLAAGDFDRDGDTDVVASNASTGTVGGLHLFLSDGLGGFATPAPLDVGSGVGRGIVSISVAALDATGTRDDLLVAYVPTTSPFTGLGGTAALRNDGIFAPVGFVVESLRTSSAGRSAVAADFADGAGIDVIEAQAAGPVRAHLDHASSGGGFDAAADLPGLLGAFTGPGASALLAGELDATPTGACPDRRELVALVPATSTVVIAKFTTWRRSAVTEIAGAGDAGVSFLLPGGDATLPNPAFALGVDAGPGRGFLLAALFIQEQTVAAYGPVAVGGGLSIVIDAGAEYLFLTATTDASGVVVLPAPLPDVPAAACLRFAAQWAVFGVTGSGGIAGLSISGGRRLVLGFP